jgi:hypothetical protein
VLICATDTHIVHFYPFYNILESITYVFSIAWAVQIPPSPPFF